MGVWGLTWFLSSFFSICFAAGRRVMHYRHHVVALAWLVHNLYQGFPKGGVSAEDLPPAFNSINLLVTGSAGSSEEPWFHTAVFIVKGISQATLKLKVGLLLWERSVNLCLFVCVVQFGLGSLPVVKLAAKFCKGRRYSCCWSGVRILNWYVTGHCLGFSTLKNVCCNKAIKLKQKGWTTIFFAVRLFHNVLLSESCLIDQIS